MWNSTALEGSKRGNLIPFHARILTTFTRLIYSRTWGSFQHQRRKWKADALLICSSCVVYLLNLRSIPLTFFIYNVIAVENFNGYFWKCMYNSPETSKCARAICISLPFVSCFWSSQLLVASLYHAFFTHHVYVFWSRTFYDWVTR